MHAAAPPASRLSRTPFLIALVLAAALALAGCDMTSDRAIPRPAAAPGVTNAPEMAAGPTHGAPSAAAAPAGSGGLACPPGAGKLIKDHIEEPAVALVGLLDGCRAASIETTLDSGSGAVGVAICNKAAEVAYAMGVGAITVTAADATEIAKGVAGSPCTREP